MANHSDSHDDGNVHVHISSIRFYLGILFVLLVLTLATVGVYQIHLGAWNLVVAIVIATIKASLVVLFFMHMRHESKFNVLLFLGSLLFGGVFLAYTLNDTSHRGQVDEYNGTSVDPATGLRPAGTAPELIAAADEAAKKEQAQDKDDVAPATADTQDPTAKANPVAQGQPAPNTPSAANTPDAGAAPVDASAAAAEENRDSPAAQQSGAPGKTTLPNAGGATTAPPTKGTPPTRGEAPVPGAATSGTAGAERARPDTQATQGREENR